MCANENAECKMKLKSAPGVDNFNDMTANLFFKITSDLLKSFVMARLVKDLQMLNEKDIPTLKGRILDAGTAKQPVLLEVVCNMRNNLVIAKNLTPPAAPDNANKHVIAPSITITCENINFAVTSRFIKACCECISNFKEIEEGTINKYINNIESLKYDKLRNLVRSRLFEHLSSFRKTNVNDLHWQLTFQNIEILHIIIIMFDITVKDDVLQTIEHHDALFNLNFHANHNAITIENSTEHGCCLVFDRVRCVFI